METCISDKKGEVEFLKQKINRIWPSVSGCVCPVVPVLHIWISKPTNLKTTQCKFRNDLLIIKAGYSHFDFSCSVNPVGSTLLPNCSYQLYCTSWLSSAAKAGNSSSSGPSSSSPAKVSQGSALSAQLCDLQHKDCLFREFRKLCAMVAENNSYNVKTQIIEKFLRKGTGGGWYLIFILFAFIVSMAFSTTISDEIEGSISTTKCWSQI